MKSSKKIISNVLEHISSSGRIVGQNSEVSSSFHKSVALSYNSYNPSLNKKDFNSIISENIFSRIDTGSIDFKLIKKRDPKYFQFKDKYYLIFPDFNNLNDYLHSTQNSKINRIRVKFKPILKDSEEFSKVQNIYKKYCRNLSCAYNSRKSYYNSIAEDVPNDFDTSEISKIESKSLLIWNLPNELSPAEIQNFFWFYDIKHCFKLYWDDNHSLSFVAFNNILDCNKFARNFHGALFNNDKNQKLLIDNL
ncbi:hypothetical protein KAFR_0B04190 [Kazachstania africana CBS 2517]|uniref:RRM domain-containing protein n=1 Tax=Kazachstania africana (strain ATCC 22294 / BCRC 22015 / CBS 2517 / CECT 1963 / NBRC 1671 / NRRL Y-8276) TaxID=1071382 RepID=H2AQR5_KAZAF|nr:hypothetical protein KAFR_0B04190 [Kazachstania africana CBS 2517]CCF56715.1 hypothetical protein KAFR_0B04190 [Kazachstania africana CBS 2517]